VYILRRCYRKWSLALPQPSKGGHSTLHGSSVAKRRTKGHRCSQGKYNYEKTEFKLNEFYNFQARLELAARLFAMGIKVTPQSPAKGHQEFFQTDNATLEQGQNAQSGVDASISLVQE